MRRYKEYQQVLNKFDSCENYRILLDVDEYKQIDIAKAERNAYIMLNSYQNSEEKKESYDKFLKAHQKYINLGGKHNISFFKHTLNDILEIN